MLRRRKTSKFADPQAARRPQADEAWIRSLYNITSSRQLFFDEKLQALLVMGCQVFQLQTGLLSRVTDNRFEVLASAGQHATLQKGSVLPLSETFCGDTLRAGGPLSIQRASGTSWANHPAHLAHDLETYLGTPLVVSGEVYGTLSFSSPKPRLLPFTSSELEYLRLIAQWIGAEIEREQNSQQIQKFALEIASKNQALSEARDRALEASRQKSNFLATVSHEIRTPMNAILGMVDLLLETPLNSDQKEYAGVARDSSQALLTMLDDLLDLSKIEAGKLNLDLADFNLSDLLERARNLFIPKARQKGLAIVSFVDPSIPSLLRGDPNRLSQILFNLIGNAIKFTDQGEVSIRAEQVGIEAGKIRIRFSVFDTGIGLSASARNRLFQPYAQADGSIARKFGGTGLGLAIAKQLVDLMGGQIGVDSQEGKGSTFWFTVLFDLSSQPKSSIVELSPQPVQAATVSSSTALQSGELQSIPPVLLAEDNPANQKIISIQLQRLGYQVVAASDGSKVLEILLQTNQRFSLLLLDCQMPEVDGFSVVRILRKAELSSGRHLPVVAMTANAMQGDREACLASGMDDYLSKPVKIENLKEVLERWSQPETSMEPVAAEGQHQETQPLLDEQIIQGLRALQVEGEDFLGGVIEMFMHEADKLVGSMRSAISTGDAEGLRKAAHTLKGSSAGMGAARLSACCLALETLAQEARLEACPTTLARLEGDYSLTIQALLSERGQYQVVDPHLIKA